MAFLHVFVLLMFENMRYGPTPISSSAAPPVGIAGGPAAARGRLGHNAPLALRAATCHPFAPNALESKAI
jgi:hypothetical protein